jgi:hypothetical protein
MIGPQPSTSHRNQKARDKKKTRMKKHPDLKNMGSGLSMHRM